MRGVRLPGSLLGIGMVLWMVSLALHQPAYAAPEQMPPRQPPPATLGGRVWEDTNADGLQDPFESGLGGVIVELHPAPAGDTCGGIVPAVEDMDDTTMIATTGSNVDGSYAFAVPDSGSYCLYFVPPVGPDYAFSPKDQGDDAVDSDVNPPLIPQDPGDDADDFPPGGRTDPLTVILSAPSLAVDAGLHEAVYVETTPICMYLDRGLNDHVEQTTDRYLVSQPGVDTLADIDQIQLGLDLPETHCVDDSHDTPCADRDYSTEWWIDGVMLSVAGVTLFSQQRAFGEDFLFVARGGAGHAGMVGIDGATLRAHPSWGLSEAEISSLIARVPISGTPSYAANQLEFEAADLALLFESLIGRELAARTKKTDCEGELYCDNARGPQIFWRGAQTPIPADCELDFGLQNCADPAERLPAPWVQLRGTTQDGDPLLQIDADLDLVFGIRDPDDCAFDAVSCNSDNSGTRYVRLGTLGAFSLEIDLAFECVPTPNNTFTIRSAVHALQVDPDFLLGVGEDVIGEVIDTSQLTNQIDESLFATELLTGLPSCPPFEELTTITPEGSVSFNVTLPPPSGPEIRSDRIITFARYLNRPHAAEPRAVLEAVYNEHVANIDWTVPYSSTIPQQIYGTTDPNEKLSMGEIDTVLPALCALPRSCSAEFNPDNVLIPPPAIDPAAALPCSDANPNVAANNAACAVLGELRAFAMQPEIWDHCIMPAAEQLGVSPASTAVVAAMFAQYQMAEVACEAELPYIEALLPAPVITLDLMTGRFPATDNFTFVDFQAAENVSPLHREQYACRHRFDQAQIPNPYTYPDCENPAAAGTLGCACADVDVSLFDPWEDGGFPDGAGSYLAHGLNGQAQYCEDSDDGNAVVCGVVEQQGNEYPVCQECGVDTNVGCACQIDTDCEGLESGLICWGSSQDGGWAPNGGGTCLPGPDDPDNWERLTEMPWFCLDNCDAIDSAQDGETACLFNQVSPLDFPHGTCVDYLLTCSVDGNIAPPGVCEEGGERCLVNPSDDGFDLCQMECTESSQCSALGYPDHYVCDFAAGFANGHCVPEECAGQTTIDNSYCALFR